MSVLICMPVTRGQKQFYKALYDAGEQGLATNELIRVMGRRDGSDLAGVLGALGRRVNGAPGYGRSAGPGIGMLFTWEPRPDGQWQYRMRPELRQALEDLNPPWLYEMA